jgi:hypothetical protein
MKTLRMTLGLFAITSLLLSACAALPQPVDPAPGSDTGDGQPSPTQPGSNSMEQPVSNETPAGAASSPLDPLPGEADMERGPVFIETQEILLLESFPVQAVLRLTGSLPTPCHILRAKVGQPDADKVIQVEVYSVTPRDQMCVESLAPFETSLPLGNYTEGTFNVVLNGEKAGEFKP